MSPDERTVLAEFVAQVAGIPDGTAGTWGWASPPGRFAASVIRLDPAAAHRYCGQSVGVKVFKTNTDAAREAATLVPFHRDRLARLPGIPNPRVQTSLDAGFATDTRGRRRGFIVQQWVCGDTLEDWIRRRWACEPAPLPVIASLLTQLLADIVVPLWSAGTIWWDVRDANFCFDADTGQLNMIDVDSPAAYAGEIIDTPATWIRRGKGRLTALARLRNMTLRLVLATGPASGKVRATAKVNTAWAPLESALLALGTGPASAVGTAIAAFLDALTSDTLGEAPTRPARPITVSARAYADHVVFNDTDVLAPFDEQTVVRYQRVQCATFRKTDEKFGGLSNMASGYPLVVNGVAIPSSEALYQACRFPNLPDVQADIITAHNAMVAKMKSKPHRLHARPDFIALRVPIMWWCLRVKLACNPATFGALLRLTGVMPIVEDSHRDSYWGATGVPDDFTALSGANVLGRLLMLLRGAFVEHGASELMVVPPPAIDGVLLYGDPVRTVNGTDVAASAGATRSRSGTPSGAGVRRAVKATADDRMFTCSRCFMQHHRSRLAPGTGGELICRDCAG
jgi:predicted NAD-dependent protein-ADP-ribosyltransferase YbiA (DUF1768 family)